MRRGLGALLRGIGLDPGRVRRVVREASLVRRDLRTFEAQRASSVYGGQFPLGRRYRIYGERSAAAGTVDGQYFHQDLLVAREIHARSPRRHIDIGSRIDGFVAHVASFREIEVLDIRPAPPVHGIVFHQVDLTDLTDEWTDAADSVSCLHALEHIGLGRYGDRVQFDGWLQGLRALTAMVQRGGILYLSVPTAEHQRIEFNAHRVFSLPFLRDVLRDDFVIERCAFVHDDGHLDEHVDPYSADAERSFGARYGCSIWVLRRND